MYRKSGKVLPNFEFWRLLVPCRCVKTTVRIRDEWLHAASAPCNDPSPRAVNGCRLARLIPHECERRSLTPDSLSEAHVSTFRFGREMLMLSETTREEAGSERQRFQNARSSLFLSSTELLKDHTLQSSPDCPGLTSHSFAPCFAAQNKSIPETFRRLTDDRRV